MTTLTPAQLMKQSLSRATANLQVMHDTVAQHEQGLLGNGDARTKLHESLSSVIAEVQEGILAYLPIPAPVDKDYQLEFYTIGYDEDFDQVVVHRSRDPEEYTVHNFVGQTAKHYTGLNKEEVGKMLLQFSTEFSHSDFSRSAHRFLNVDIVTTKNKHALLDGRRIIAYINEAIATQEDIEGLCALGYKILPLAEVKEYDR